MSFLPDKPVKYRKGGFVNLPKNNSFAVESTNGSKTVFIPKSQTTSVIQPTMKKQMPKTKGKAKKASKRIK